MQKIYPHDKLVSKYVEYYWQLDNKEIRDIKWDHIYDFPCLSSELIIDFEGLATFFYKSRTHQLQPGTLFGYMDTGISTNISQITSISVVRFKSMGPAAYLPFLSCSAHDLIRSHFVDANQVFSRPISNQLKNVLRTGAISEKRDALDNWLRQCFTVNRVAFLNELINEIEPYHDVNEVAKMSSMSLSSLERYFKKEVGMTPKKFLLHNRFRLVLQDIARAEVIDWQDLIFRYNYYDQNHLIKEVKRFSGLTPVELLRADKLSTLREAG